MRGSPRIRSRIDPFAGAGAASFTTLMLPVHGHLSRVAVRVFARMASGLLAIGPARATRSAGRLLIESAVDRPAFADTQAGWRKI
jgi:hypothetical protein